MSSKFPNDFSSLSVTIIRQIKAITGIEAVLEEPEKAKDERPCLPYISMVIINPGVKSGDDSKQNVKDDEGHATSVWNSGGCRKMLVDFNAYATTHEEAYNYMSLWQTALDLEDIQQNLRAAGIAVWVIGTVANLSKLLNTGYEGRAHLDCSFGIAMNLQSDLGYMDTVTVNGAVTTDQNNVVNTTQTIAE